jgi:hypothetical protein
MIRRPIPESLWCTLDPRAPISFLRTFYEYHMLGGPRHEARLMALLIASCKTLVIVTLPRALTPLARVSAYQAT